jgi:hypothetical protein
MPERCSRSGCGRPVRPYKQVKAAAKRISNTLPAGQEDGSLVLMGRLLMLAGELAGACPRCVFREVLASGIGAALARTERGSHRG